VILGNLFMPKTCLVEEKGLNYRQEISATLENYFIYFSSEIQTYNIILTNNLTEVL
jgi:hypothetical protein